MGGNLVLNSNQVLFSSELATRGAGLILKVLLNPTSGRDDSHPYTHYGTPNLRPSAYKARVGGISPRCGIVQIRAGGSKGRPCPSQSGQYLIGERY